jgi:hypothetical protein
VKEELKNTSIQITCLDEDGNVLKRVTSGDSGDIEDPENGGTNDNQNQNENGGGSQNQGGNTGGNTGGNDQGGGDDVVDGAHEG